MVAYQWMSGHHVPYSLSLTRGTPRMEWASDNGIPTFNRSYFRLASANSEGQSSNSTPAARSRPARRNRKYLFTLHRGFGGTAVGLLSRLELRDRERHLV